MNKKSAFKFFIITYCVLIRLAIIHCSAGAGNFVLASGQKTQAKKITLGAPLTPKQPALEAKKNSLIERYAKTRPEPLRIGLLRSRLGNSAEYKNMVYLETMLRDAQGEILFLRGQKHVHEALYNKLKVENDGLKAYKHKIESVRCCCFLCLWCYPYHNQRYDFE